MSAGDLPPGHPASGDDSLTGGEVLSGRDLTAGGDVGRDPEQQQDQAVLEEEPDEG